MHDYLGELLEWYGGEVGGEAFFAALAQGAGDPSHAAKWAKLAQLERHVADRLRNELTRRGVTVPAAAADLQRGLDNARQYARLGWRESLERLRVELIGYVGDFEAAESRMPQDALALARFVTAHERALLEFVSRELAPDGANSLESVTRLLGPATEYAVEP